MIPERLRVAVAQMCSGPDRDANLEQAETLMATAAESGVRLLVLPENFAVFGRRDLHLLAEPGDGSGVVERFLSSKARQHQLWLVAGTAPYLVSGDGRSAAAGKVFPSCGVWSPAGDCVTRHDKCHLFDVDVADGVGQYRESDNFAPGLRPVIAETPWGTLGLSICYDLRFPEYYRALTQMGATMLTVPSAFTYRTGEAHWEVLLRARAIENQCFVLAANQVGKHDAKRQTWGHSCVIDPWGRVLACRQEDGPGLAIADLDFAELHDLRQKMPVLSHRRF